MAIGSEASFHPVPLEAALRSLEQSPDGGLLALGLPGCPSCLLLPATLEAIAAARPSLEIALSLMATPPDWARREDLLWPRGIYVSRASLPSLALLHDGRTLAVRHGGGPAHVIDAWLAQHLGPAANPLRPEATEAEARALVEVAPRRSRMLAVKDRQ